MDTRHAPYVPILKTKAGEFNAVAHLSIRARDGLTPFFDVLNPGPVNGDALEGYLAKMSGNIARSWGPGRPLYLDFYDLSPDLRCNNGVHPVTFAHSQLARLGLTPTPVFGFERGSDGDLLKATRGLSYLRNTGLAVRLEEDDIAWPDELKEKMERIMTSVQLSNKNIDLIVDMRSIVNRSVTELSQVLLNGLNELEEGKRYRSVVLASSSIPKNMADIEKDSTVYVERREFFIWSEMIRRVDRTIRFGDYGVVNPDFVDPGPNPNTNAKIRYTLQSDWMILRGHRLSEDRDQYRTLSDRLLFSGRFLGAGYSWGDQRMEQCANGLYRGTPRTWVPIDMNHHLEFVSAQVAADGQKHALLQPSGRSASE